MKSIFLICFLLASTSAFAAVKKGNGGNAIICGDSAELLDFYEGRIIYGYNHDEEEKPWKEILKERIVDLKTHDSDIGESLEKWLADFDKEALFLPNIDLGNINDSLHVIIPEGCQAKQTINQQFKPLSTEKRYWISQKIWNQFSETDKAGIIFHEFSYRYLQFDDSRVVRELTAFVFSTTFQTLSKDEVHQALKMLGL